MTPRRWLELAVLAPAMAAALAVAGTAFSALGDDGALLRREQGIRPIRAVDLERVLLTTPEPYLDHRRDAVRARCPASGAGEPARRFVCVVRYRSGRSARLVVSVVADGSFRARIADSDSGSIVGCCVQPGGPG